MTLHEYPVPSTCGTMDVKEIKGNFLVVKKSIQVMFLA